MRIVNREQILLTEADKKLLAAVRLKRTIFLVLAYLSLVAILGFIFMTGQLRSTETSLEKMLRYQRATNLLTGGSLVIFTIIFIIYYFKTVYPFTRDLKKGLKTVSWFYPAAYKTPYFDSFFLKTGSPKKPMLPIPKNLFDAIEPGVLAYILIAPASRFVFLLDIDGQQLEFNERNVVLDL